MTSGWRGVRRSAPCPACEGFDRCAWSSDGAVLHCFRTHAAPMGMRAIKFEQRGAFFVSCSEERRGARAVRLVRESEAPAPDLGSELARLRERTTPGLLAAVARSLEVSVRALELLEPAVATDADLRRLRVGFAGFASYPSHAAVFPERNGAGRLVGLGFRAPDGRKGFAKGHARGLVIPMSFAPVHDEFVLIVEGPSDVAAMLTLGATAVGRPSNRGGVEHLAELLRDCTHVLVVGENDRKANGDWPGRDGAVHVANGLANAWGRSVRFALPPPSVKDAREWLRAYRGAEVRRG